MASTRKTLLESRGQRQVFLRAEVVVGWADLRVAQQLLNGGVVRACHGLTGALWGEVENIAANGVTWVVPLCVDDRESGEIYQCLQLTGEVVGGCGCNKEKMLLWDNREETVWRFDRVLLDHRRHICCFGCDERRRTGQACCRAGFLCDGDRDGVSVQLSVVEKLIDAERAKTESLGGAPGCAGCMDDTQDH